VGSNPAGRTSLRSEHGAERRLPRRSAQHEGGRERLSSAPSYGSARQLMDDSQKFYYVYILESVSCPGRFYTGFTEDLKQRLKDHNTSHSPHTAKFGPWRLKTYLGFSDRIRALEFERYLKTASGRAFAAKRL
jgi:putative endonuclease